jgi:NAD-dependent deacetylase
LWKQFRPEDLATPAAFERHPELVWEWYDWRRGLIARANPNTGHFALVELERQALNFTLITQNVDGLHQATGSSSVLEVHGSIWTLSCVRCQRSWLDRTVPLAGVPHCVCGGLARPGVVWFGESLPENVWRDAKNAAETCDVLLIVGTSGSVYPAAGLVQSAKSAGARTIEVNTETTVLSPFVDCSLQGLSGESLPKLLTRTDNPGNEGRV